MLVRNFQSIVKQLQAEPKYWAPHKRRASIALQLEIIMQWKRFR